MLVQAKNPDLFRSWIDYLERTSQMTPPEIRCFAYFWSQEARPVPLM